MGICIRGINKWYGQNGRRDWALQGIDLSIDDGEFVSIVGPSGCGKSTLLQCIAGLDFPNEGMIQVNGRGVAGPGTDRVAVFQDPSLFPWLTVRENVEFGLRIRGVPRRERTERAMQYLRMVHLGRFAALYPKELSGGMRQRAAIARALALDPEILLMDEPFAALDAQTRQILIGEVQEVWQRTGKTIVFVTHNLDEALLLSDTIVLLTAKPGRISLTHRVASYRPRDLREPYLVALHQKVMAHLETEIAKVAQAEMDADWQPAMGRVSGKPDYYLGDSI